MYYRKAESRKPWSEWVYRTQKVKATIFFSGILQRNFLKPNAPNNTVIAHTFAL